MRTMQEWTLLVIFGILYCVSGKLHQPLNIKTESRNFSLFLTWLPAPENPPNVTYTVRYMLVMAEKWQAVKKCRTTFATECDLTCALIQNFSNLHRVQVRAVSVSQEKSSWVLLDNITYMFTVDPSPPILQIKRVDDGSLIVNTSVRRPLCAPPSFPFFLYLKHVLEIRNINNPGEQIRKIEMMKSSELIKTDAYEGEYCLTVSAILEITRKNSTPSPSICLTFSQKDQNHHLLPLVGLPVILLVFVIVSAIFTILHVINLKATIPKSLDFSHKRCVLLVSVTHEDNPYPLTINKNMDQTSSSTYLLSSEDCDSINEYPLSGCGYTERKTINGGSLVRDSCYGDSTSGGYMSSEGLPTNSSSDKSSNNSCIQTSGSSTEMTLMLNKIQLHDQSSEGTDMIVSGYMETLVTNSITKGPLLDTLHVLDCNSFQGTLLNTLSMAPANDQCPDNESNDFHLTDSDGSHEEITKGCTDCDVPTWHIVSYVGSHPLQRNQCSGYEKRGYMSRR
ncbi:interferon lambda receptor 1 [Pyxicephalus adspersus]|uniref:interferon lambda receptor 1 n=1 Tax=Pyxicephalus adspersus TaxID=30357 RepID=UPI003B59B432